MVNLDILTPLLTQAFGRVLAVLGADAAEGADLVEQGRAYARRKSEIGRAGIASALGLTEGEVPAFDAAVRDVERTAPSAEADEVARRNALIARVRLLSWLESVGQRRPELVLDAEVEAAVSEDVGRKQVRALELIVRALITESYENQEKLVQRLREALSDRVVDKWRASADADDILSGCTFSELASLFANRQEFDRYEGLYEDTSFLTFLKQRRKTVQAFLDDTRRIRNILAHNKRITPIQLALLDLYYEELVDPVQRSHDEGETRVDPAAYIDVDGDVLASYVSGLSEDVQSVKDDLGDLKTSLLSAVGDVKADTTEIRETTRGVNRKLVVALAGVGLLILLAFLLLGQGGETKDSADAARTAAETAASSGLETAGRLEDLRETTEAAHERTETALARTESTAARTEAATARTEASAERTEAVARDTATEVEGLRETTEAVAERTDEAAAAAEAAAASASEAAEVSKETSARVVQSLDQLREGFAALTQTGGIIADATRPQEHYHNARVYGQRGDVAKAMQSYRAFFASGELGFVDPHLRYQALLKLHEGLGGARETYFAMKEATENPVVHFAWMLVLDRAARVERLTAFLEEQPDFAPAFYALSRDYSAARLGTQSVEDKGREKELLTRYLELQEQGTFLEHYLDQSVANEEVEDARTRLAALATFSEAVRENPVRLSGMPHSTGWSIYLSIADTVKEIFYRVNGEGPWKSTGFTPGVHTREGLPMANPSLAFGHVGAMMIQVKYVDPRGQEHGPYDLSFDPISLRLSHTRSILESQSSHWAIITPLENGQTWVNFSTLLSNRGVIKEIRYGLNKEVPDKTFAFTPADPLNPGGMDPNDDMFVRVRGKLNFVSVQIVYTDGKASEVVRIDA